MSEAYVGIPRFPELRRAAQHFLSNETSRSVCLFLDGHTLEEVAVANGRNKKVVNDMKVAENLARGRLVHTQRYVLRRTERACFQMLQGRFGVNTTRHLEYLQERCCAEAARLGYPMPKRAKRVYER